jgi:molybdopterin synthase sulfur carrier subunit
MIVKVKTFASLREILGREISLELEQRATIKDLISSLCSRFKNWNIILDESGDIKSSILILKNGRNIRFLEKFLTQLQVGDEIKVFPPLDGG